MRRGGALIVAIWVIAVLSVMVLSFSFEARHQGGINVYVRERNRVSRLIEPGRMLAEVVISGYADAKEWSPDESLDDLLEEDRWALEKRALKYDSKCTIGPILIDDRAGDDGLPLNPSTVRVEIELVNAGEKNAINVNELYEGGDKNYRLRWEMILTNAGIPDDYEVDVEVNGSTAKVPLTDHLIACWQDWRDEDDTVTAIDGKECGAESAWYEEKYEDDEEDDENKLYPRNGSIPAVEELSYIRGFSDYPAVLTGGVLNPDADKEDQITVKGIRDLFGTTGTAKVNVNSCTVEQLLTIPGIFDEEDVDEGTVGGADSQGRLTAEAIVAARREMPEYDVDETRSWWPYKDWDDLTQRVADYSSDAKLGQDANEYLTYVPDAQSLFKVSIIGESMGMRKEVQAEGYYNSNDKKMRYISWREN
jgi:hypothetical protein